MNEQLNALIDDISALIANGAGSLRLSAMTNEAHKIYNGLSTGQADWLKAQVYAALAHITADQDAIDAAKEDLRTSNAPIVLAGVSRMLSAQGLAAADWMPIASDARQRLVLQDVYPDIRIKPLGLCCAPKRTALGDVDALIAHLETDLSDVLPPQWDAAPITMLSKAATKDIMFCDSNDEAMSFDTLFTNRTAIMGFFYTRCMNPQKCSRTVSHLGQLAESIPRKDRNAIAVGISYEPQFDTAARLRGYGLDRQFPFGDRARLVRCTKGWSKLRKLLALRVGYGTNTVNAHSREIFVLRDGSQINRIPPSSFIEAQHFRDVLAKATP